MRKGGPKKPMVSKRTGKEFMSYGDDLDWFRFTSDDPETIKAFDEVYGSKPKTLRMFLVGKRPEDCFDPWKEEFNGRGELVHACNGKYAVFWRDEKDVTHHDPTCAEKHPCPFAQTPDKSLCKETGRMWVILPELCQRLGRMFGVLLMTHSKHDIVHWDTQLRKVFDREDVSTLQGIPFVLSRERVMVGAPNPQGGKRLLTEKSLVRLSTAADWELAWMHKQQAGVLALPAKAMVIDSNTGEILGNADQVEGEVADTDDVQDDDWLDGVEEDATATPAKNPDQAGAIEQPEPDPIDSEDVPFSEPEPAPKSATNKAKKEAHWSDTDAGIDALVAYAKAHALSGVKTLRAVFGLTDSTPWSDAAKVSPTMEDAQKRVLFFVTIEQARRAKDIDVKLFRQIVVADSIPAMYAKYEGNASEVIALLDMAGEPA